MTYQGEYCYCGENKYKKLFTAKGHEIVQCLACKQARVMTPSTLMRKQVYGKADLQVYIDKETMFRKLFRHLIQFIQRYRENGVLVDIGAGAGLLVSEAQRAGFRAYGFEPSHAAIQIAKKHFNVNLLQGKFTPKVFGRRADVIVLNHVLEHLPDPKKAIIELTPALNPDGLLVIGVPKFGSIMANLKKSKWQSLIPDQHRWQFTFITLNALLSSCGYRHLGMQTENHDRSMHYWWKRPIYWFLDFWASQIYDGDAMLMVYQKI